MSTFRILDQAPQYLLPNGKVNAGGSLTFYETDLSTPKLTWSDPEQTTPNPNPMPLDAAGRTLYDVWGEGEYGAVRRAPAGVAIWTRNNVRLGGDAGQEIPALVAGHFLTNDGSNLQWAPIREVPDPTGSNGQVLSTDGTNLNWIPLPEPPESDIGVQVGAAGYQWTNGLLIQWGSDSAPASGDKSTTKAASFPISFDEAPYHIGLTPKLGTITQNDSLVCATYTNPGSSGFTANFSLADDDNKSWKAINVAVPFTWMAIGKKTTRPDG